MFRLLSISFALLAVSCGATPKVVTKIVTPEPCHIPNFPVLPDFAISEGQDSEGEPLITMSVPAFSQLAEWMDDVGQWKEKVEACSQVRETLPEPQSTPSPQ